MIKIEPTKPLQVMPMGTSSDLMLGETVFAVGNAFGYEHTVTSGIISSLSRDVEVNEKQSYEHLIQTDASINPGNSGGPLLNVDGEIIGINVAIRAGHSALALRFPSTMPAAPSPSCCRSKSSTTTITDSVATDKKSAETREAHRRRGHAR